MPRESLLGHIEDIEWPDTLDKSTDILEGAESTWPEVALGRKFDESLLFRQGLLLLPAEHRRESRRMDSVFGLCL